MKEKLSVIEVFCSEIFQIISPVSLGKWRNLTKYGYLIDGNSLQDSWERSVHFHIMRFY